MTTLTKVESYIDLILNRSFANNSITRKMILSILDSNGAKIDDSNLSKNKNVINKVIFETIASNKKTDPVITIAPNVQTTNTTINDCFRSLLVPRVGNELFSMMSKIDEVEKLFLNKVETRINNGDTLDCYNYTRQIAGKLPLAFSEFKSIFKKSFFKNLFSVLKEGNWDFTGVGFYSSDKEFDSFDKTRYPHKDYYPNFYYRDDLAVVFSFVQRNNSIIAMNIPKAKIENNVNLGKYGVHIIYSFLLRRALKPVIFPYQNVPKITYVGRRFAHVFGDVLTEQKLSVNNYNLPYFCFGNFEHKYLPLLKKLNFNSILFNINALLSYVDKGASIHADVSTFDSTNVEFWPIGQFAKQISKEQEILQNSSPLVNYIFDIAASKLIPKTRKRRNELNR